MDGPNVNWSLLEKLAIPPKLEDSYASDLLNIGGCSLDVVHGFFDRFFIKEDRLKPVSIIKIFLKGSPVLQADY